MLAAIVRLDVDGVSVLIGGRFPICPFQGRDAEGFAVLPVPAFGNNDGSRCFQLCGEGSQRGGAVALVTQLLGDVQEHVRFVHDDRFKLGGRFLVRINYVDI
ncbi:hypothetical protein [Arthrobacter sp. NicSoilB11]|uniref:hypothetical protein n=1 Tax=Arthrobacter sp. NicSoilB11 TaxID=2830999 RepID=UPI001E71D1FD|nr:hypothetical protein NicSoilB11_41960 [Arthrobacter sp. NicSoilB11]